MTSRSEPRVRRRVPLVLVPWAVYLGVTLVAPALNGAARGEAFAEHAILTLGVSGAMTMLWLAAGRRGRMRQRRGGFEAADGGIAPPASRSEGIVTVDFKVEARYPGV